MRKFQLKVWRWEEFWPSHFLLLFFSGLIVVLVTSNSFATPWTIAQQAPLSMGFCRQEYWNGLPFPSPGDRPNPEIEPISLALAGRFLTTEPPGKPLCTLCVLAAHTQLKLITHHQIAIPCACKHVWREDTSAFANYFFMFVLLEGLYLILLCPCFILGHTLVFCLRTECSHEVST